MVDRTVVVGEIKLQLSTFFPGGGGCEICSTAGIGFLDILAHC